MSASFISAMNTRAEDAVEETSATENECPVCHGPCAKLSVTCCNGHTICEKHYLQRHKAIYEDGSMADINARLAAAAERPRCFMCRCNLENKRFSKTFYSLQDIVISQGLIKMFGIQKDFLHIGVAHLRSEFPNQ